MAKDMPLLLSKQKAMEFIGISRNLFDTLEPELPFVRLKKAKRYNPEDIKREIENMRRSPCTPLHSKTKKTATNSIQLSQLMDLGGFEEAVRRTKGERQTSTH